MKIHIMDCTKKHSVLFHPQNLAEHKVLQSICRLCKPHAGSSSHKCGLNSGNLLKSETRNPNYILYQFVACGFFQAMKQSNLLAPWVRWTSTNPAHQKVLGDASRRPGLSSSKQLDLLQWVYISSHLYLQKQVRNHWNHPESIELVHIVPTVYEIKLKCKSDTNYTYTHTLQTCTRVFISKHRNDSDLQDLSFPLRSWTKNNKIEDKHMFFEQWDTTKTVRKKSSRMRCRFNICKNHKISTEYTRTPTEVGILI